MAKGGRPYKVHEDLNQLRSLIMNGDKLQIENIITTHGIEAFDRHKRTSIIWASFFEEIEILKWLINKGANVNHQDKIGYSCLHFCGQEHNLEAARILLEYGANPNILDEHDNSPLWTAIFNSKDRFDLIKLLRLNGADHKQKNKHGRSPNDLAISIYNKEIDELIKV